MIKRLSPAKLLSDYGSLLILGLLCAYYSFATLGEQHPITPASGRAVARRIQEEKGVKAAVLIVIRDTQQDRQFAAAIEEQVLSDGGQVLGTVSGSPVEVRKTLLKLAAAGTRLDAIATHRPGSEWGPLQPEKLAALANQHSSFSGIAIYQPRSYVWPSFLTRENLVNVINQNAVVAIIAIGMTMVIITGGIDLSVGSLMAISGVVTAIAIQQLAGGAQAGWFGLVGCCLLAITLCTLCGAINGVLVTRGHIPAFIVTLGTMMIARGVALILAVRYQSFLSGGKTAGTPEAVKIGSQAFGWLGNGDTLGIPNPILLMIVLYVAAHVMMTRTVVGRYIYAVGGNAQAARFSGLPVMRVLILVYAICGAMAGLGGVVDASRFEGGRPNAGELYELQVIAAVVVGGASLAGGEGRIFGTLVGAMIMAVIQNGLNMAGVKSYEQKVIFGLLILAAVLLDQLKKRNWRAPYGRKQIMNNFLNWQRYIDQHKGNLATDETRIEHGCGTRRKDPCFVRVSSVANNILMIAWMSFLILVVSPLHADVRLPHLIANHMVLQREMPIRIWGWADSAEIVEVSLNQQQATATTSDDGKWEVKLPSMKAGGPFEMTVEGKNKLTVEDVLIGEVWLCSGQSNMAWLMVSKTTDMDREMAAADYPQMRLLMLPQPDEGKPIVNVPKDDIAAEWRVCSPKTVGWFSAVAYYFGRELHRELKVPVAVMVSAVNGTRIENWTAAVGVESVPELTGKDKIQDGDLFNTMIRPFTPLAIRGVIWYQGEGNVGDGFIYYHRMRALVNGWRNVWDQGEFPFYYVQIAPLNWGGKPKDQQAEIWEAQTAALAIPNTGMVVTNDIGNTGDAHPRNKRDVGKRLAAWALAKTYGKDGIAYAGPLYQSMKIEGDKIRIHFEHATDGLASRDGKPLTWFTIAGEDGKFVDADAQINGETVMVSSDQVPDPKAVRFAWHQIAEPNLMNKAGLPASAFRTDGPPISTE